MGQGLWEGKSLRERAHREGVVSLLLCFPSYGRNLWRRRSLIANEATSLCTSSSYAGQSKEGLRLNVTLLQLGVFGLGLHEDGDIGIGVFPEGEEIIVGSVGFSGVAL